MARRTPRTARNSPAPAISLVQRTRVCPAHSRIGSRRSNAARPTRCRAAPLHAAPVLPSHLEQRVRNLPERAAPYRVHQHFEDVFVHHHRPAQPLQQRRRLSGIARLERAQPLKLRALLLRRRARELELTRVCSLPCTAPRIAERIDADDGVRAVVLLVLVVERLFL